MKRILLMILSLLLLTACGEERAENESKSTNNVEIVENFGEKVEIPPYQAENPLTEPEEIPPPDPKSVKIGEILSQMTLEEKVGQMFFVRCPGADQAALVGQYHLGGYLLFGRDFKDSAENWLTEEQFSANIAAYQDAALSDTGIPLLIGSDEEGGTVTRATRNPNLFPAKLPSPQALYNAGGLTGLLTDTLLCNDRLRAYGINVNFAPVADVSTDSADFIYDRSFGQNAQTTADYIGQVVDVMNKAGIGSVLKHFPGYGSNVDTHTGIAVDERSYDQFVQADFLPFQAGIAAGAGSVLVSHNIVTSMDADLPASLSPAVHRVLREDLGFTGVILTDDLAMDAVEAYAQEGSVAVLAVQAGNDMIVTTDFTTQIPAVIAAVESGEIPLETIDTAVERILGWKYDLGLFDSISSPKGEPS